MSSIPFPAMALIVAAVFAAPAPLAAVTCDVNPYQAFQVAQARGWAFLCQTTNILPGAIVTNSVLPEPPNRIGCLWRTGPVAVPLAPHGRMNFFNHTDYRRPNGQLRNGWRIASWELSGGNYTAQPPNQSSRILARMTLDRHGRTFQYRLTRLVLSRDGGSCANALTEAF